MDRRSFFAALVGIPVAAVAAAKAKAGTVVWTNAKPISLAPGPRTISGDPAALLREINAADVVWKRREWYASEWDDSLIAVPSSLKEEIEGYRYTPTLRLAKRDQDWLIREIEAARRYGERVLRDYWATYRQ